MRLRRALVPWLSVTAFACATPNPARPARAPSAKAPPPPSARACVEVDGCERACDAGDASSCDAWWARFRVRPGPASVADVVARLDRACSGGSGEACQDLAGVVTLSPDLPADTERGARLLARACELGRTVSCLQDDRSLLDPKSGPPSPDQIARKDRAERDLFARCEGHDGTACAVASILLLTIDHDVERSRRYATRAGDELEASCLSGGALDCERGALQIAGSPAPQPARARRLFERGCALGLGRACTEAARAAEGTAAELASRFDDACKKGDPEGCFELAKRAPKSDVARVVDEGLTLARAGCGLGDGASCDAIVSGLAFDAVAPARAKELAGIVERICDRGVGPTCGALAKLLLDGPTSLRDPARGGRLRVRACDLDYPFACHDPMALLGAYPPIDAPVLDLASGLEWSPPSPREIDADAAGNVCPTDPAREGFRLPTRAELATLAEGDDGLRPFASATSPSGGHLLSSEDAGDGARLAMSVRHGSFSAQKKGFVRCVRAVGPSREAPVDELSLAMKGLDLVYTLSSPRRKVKLTSSVPGDADANRGFQLVWDGANFPGPADVAVEHDVSWATALRFATIAMHDGLRVRRFVARKPR